MLKVRRRRLAVVGVTLILMLVLSACTLKETANYEVDNDGYSGVLMTVYEKATNQMGTLYLLVFNKNARATCDFLRDQIPVDGWGAAEWHTALDYACDDLAWNLQDTINQGSQDNWNIGGPCIVLNVWVELELGGYSKHYDWRSVGGNYYSCKVGETIV